MNPASHGVTASPNCYHDTMVRTQVSLTEEQLSALRQRAYERGLSIAALLREAVDTMLEGAGRDDDVARALAVVGRYRSAPDDVSEEHDRHLDEIYRG